MRLTDWCACAGSVTGRPPLIDLDDQAFRELAPLSKGVIRVEVESRRESVAGDGYGGDMTENELKTFVLRAAKTYGWMVYHVPQATMHNGGGKGYPDLTLAKMGRPPLWIELKQQGAKLTPEQDEWHLALSPRALRDQAEGHRQRGAHGRAEGA